MQAYKGGAQRVELNTHLLHGEVCCIAEEAAIQLEIALLDNQRIAIESHKPARAELQSWEPAYYRHCDEQPLQ